MQSTENIEDSLSANHSFQYLDYDNGNDGSDNIGALLKNMRMNH